MSDSSQPRELLHARLPCPSPSPRICPSSCLLNRWFHPTISSSVTLFSFCLQSLPASALSKYKLTLWAPPPPYLGWLGQWPSSDWSKRFLEREAEITVYYCVSTKHRHALTAGLHLSAALCSLCLPRLPFLLSSPLCFPFLQRPSMWSFPSSAPASSILWASCN